MHWLAMNRIFWMVGLVIALLMLLGFVLMCAFANITHRHLNFGGWAMLVFGVVGLKCISTGLRSAIQFGDPTGTASSESADSSASGRDSDFALK